MAIGWNDIAIIFATFVGPIAAVQAQKFLEKRRDIEGKKAEIFRTLMATRNARISPDHVRALNSIAIDFYGTVRPSAPPKRSKSEQAVMNAWKEYHTHLNIYGDGRPLSQKEIEQWGARGEELFLNLIVALAAATNYEFDRAELRGGAYLPRAYDDNEQEQLAIRRMVREVLEGSRPLPLDIRAISAQPQQPAASAAEPAKP
ncbi:DUF6680 family protein [Pseudacidovorax intermedius]|uniref:DUF6680 family protein n=1 Tax=Pseudacidovorax intermedius TaxID=433924 RepID=UPI0011C02522|nr:DUF6680 family protein [Pseudacidovorax intermedius]